MKKAFRKLVISVLVIILSSCSIPERVEKQEEPVVIESVVSWHEPEIDPVKKEPVKVGMLLPLTGQFSSIGEDLRNAGVLAQFEVARDNLEISFYDTLGSAEGAKEAFKQAYRDKVKMILGPVFAQEVEAIADLARWNDIPVFSFTSDKSDLGTGVYSLALTLQNQTQRIIRFACEKKAKKLVIAVPDNKAGDIAVDSAKQMAEACGMELVCLAVYHPDKINLDPIVSQVLPEEYIKAYRTKRQEKKNQRMGIKTRTEKETLEKKQELSLSEQVGFDALFLADDGNRLKSVSSLFGLYDITPDEVLFLGLSQWNEKSISKEGSLKNAYYPLLPQKAYRAFETRFEETYGHKPKRLASLAYDAVALSSALAETENPVDYLENTRSVFRGVDGLFRFNADGTVERLMGVYQIKGPDRVILKEYPSRSFDEEDAHKQQLGEIKAENEAYFLAKEMIQEQQETPQEAQ